MMVAPPVADAVQRARQRVLDHLSRHPPRWTFHAIAAVPVLGVLYVESFPGFVLGPWLLIGPGLILAVVTWAVWLGVYVEVRRKGRSRGNGAWFFVAPLVGAVAMALVVNEAPLRIRWEMSESAFEQAVAAAPPPTARDAPESFEVPGRVGYYDISGAFRQGDAVIFHEGNGAFLDDAGFAYLPSGPFPELESGSFEAPSFRHITGPWYAWTASW